MGDLSARYSSLDTAQAMDKRWTRRTGGSRESRICLQEGVRANELAAGCELQSGSSYTSAGAATQWSGRALLHDHSKPVGQLGLLQLHFSRQNNQGNYGIVPKLTDSVGLWGSVQTDDLDFAAN